MFIRILGGLKLIFYPLLKKNISFVKIWKKEGFLKQGCKVKILLW